MPLADATRVGPYEVLGPLGAGGMGEVYRAYDPRLDREVAVKVVRGTLSTDPDRLERFQREARATAALNHPNLLAVFDFGTHDGAPYIVAELLEGESLRQRLRAGPVPTRKLIDYAVQIASGLAAAHAKGIVHRDLKPENIFVTAGHRVKILDFGLAKLTYAASHPAPSDATASLLTDPGRVLGTPGYMSPEQVRGDPADARSDIFSLGCVLYEMATARRPFAGATAAESLNAILTEETPELPASVGHLAPQLDRIVRRCLEKSPEDRFQSAQDLAFSLDSLTGSSDAAPRMATFLPRRRKIAILAGIALVVGAIAGAAWFGYRADRQSQPSFHRLTYRRGTIRDARFTPEGQSIVYGAAWDGEPYSVFTTRADSADSRDLGLANAQLLAISSRGELAVLARPQRSGALWAETGTLARVPLAGGAPREVMDRVSFADWSPDGMNLAIIRTGPAELRYPADRVIRDGAGREFSCVRVSHNGSWLALFDSSNVDDYGRVIIVGRDGGKRAESNRIFTNLIGLAWSAGDREVWFTAASSGGTRALYAMDFSGRLRVLLRVPGWLTLKDISRDGRVLLARENEVWGIRAGTPDGAAERDLSWYSWSVLGDISPDGKTIVFTEGGEAGEDHWGVYIRTTDGAPAVRLGDGVFGKLSPDGRWVAALTQYAGEAPTRLVVLPSGAGEIRVLSNTWVSTPHAMWGWLPDGSGILFSAADRDGLRHMAIARLPGGEVSAIPAGGGMGAQASPDGRRFIARGPQGWTLAPVQGGAGAPVRGMQPRWQILGWHTDGRLRVAEIGTEPLDVLLLDPSTGQTEAWKKLSASAFQERAGVVRAFFPLISRDGSAYAYTYHRQLSDLYIVDGVR